MCARTAGELCLTLAPVVRRLIVTAPSFFKVRLRLSKASSKRGSRAKAQRTFSELLNGAERLIPSQHLCPDTFSESKAAQRVEGPAAPDFLDILAGVSLAELIGQPST